MPVKVKRGLGLLVVALMGFLLVMALQGSSNGIAVGLTLFGGAVMLCAGCAGLVLLAWGLLRD